MQPAKLNLDLLSKLLKDNKNSIRQALELFVETTREDMNSLGQKILDRKFMEGSRLAHSLKSRFVYLGNDEACEKIKLLEGLLKDGRESTANDIKKLFSQLDILIDNCISLVKLEIKELEN